LQREEDIVRNVRGRRRPTFDLRRVTLGDWILLSASLFSVVSLFMPWFHTSVPRPHDEWAFTASEWAAVAVIVFFLATVLLVLYPVLAHEMGLPSLPFATPLLFFFMGSVLLLVFTYELGKYDCIECQGISRGFGTWVAWICAWAYMVGSVIKWGSRPARRTDLPA
jgi:hypothetical protein